MQSSHILSLLLSLLAAFTVANAFILPQDSQQMPMLEEEHETITLHVTLTTTLFAFEFATATATETHSPQPTNVVRVGHRTLTLNAAPTPTTTECHGKSKSRHIRIGASNRCDETVCTICRYQLRCDEGEPDWWATPIHGTRYIADMIAQLSL
jgi:hypothetical protein